MKKKKNKEIVPTADKQVPQPTEWTHGECPIHFSTRKDEDGNEKMHVLLNSSLGASSIEQRFVEAKQQLTGTHNSELASNAINQTVNVIKKNGNTDEAYNVVSQFLSESKPKDALEAFLLNQILAFQELGMRALGKMEKADMMVHAEFNGKMAAKLFHLQHSAIDKLVKYKSGGEQKVVVQHVNVENGGKAIVGNFDGIGGGGII